MSRSKRREERARRQREATNKKLEESAAMGDVDRISRLKDSSFKNSLLERARKRREELGSGTGVGQTQGANSLTGNSILNRLTGERPITGGPGKVIRAQDGTILQDNRPDPSRRMGMLETKGPEQLRRQRDLLEGLRGAAQGQTIKSGQITDPLTGQIRFETPEEKQKKLDLMQQQIQSGGKRITPQQPVALPTKVQEQQPAQQPAQQQQAAQQQAQVAQQQQAIQPQSIGPQQQEAQMKAQMYQTQPAQQQQPKPAEQPPQMAQQPAQQPEESEEEKQRRLQAQQMA